MHIDLLPKAALIIQADSCILKANSLAVEFLGSSVEGLVGQKIAPLLTSYDSETFVAFLSQITPDKPARRITHLVDRGTIRYLAMDIAKLPDSTLLLLLEDISEQENTLARAEQYISFLECQNKTNPVAMILVNNALKIRSFNPAFQKLLDRDSLAAVGQDIGEQMLQISKQVREPQPFLRIVQQVVDHHLSEINDAVELKNGRILHLSTQPLMEANNMLGRAWYFRDMTNVKEMQDRIDSQQIFQNAVLEHIEDGIVACDANGELSMFNRASRELHGLGSDATDHELWVEHYSLFHHDEENSLQPVEIPLIRALNGMQLKNEEMTIRCADGVKREVQVSGQAMCDKGGTKLGAVISMHDITDLKHAKEELRAIAYLDPLTGMPNRRLFHDLLDQAIRRAKRNSAKMAVLFLDLDNFKTVNDELGHDMGDQLLRELAAALKTYLRESDILCRWGGDEFVVALPNITTNDDAELVAAKIGGAIRNTLQDQYEACQISTSIGIAIYPDHAQVPDLLIRSADKAMYSAKQQGKDRYCFAPLHLSELEEFTVRQTADT